jgi:hypothetical protein
MPTKIIAPGTTGNLQTDLGGAPSSGDSVIINEGAVSYTTVPDWSGTDVVDVIIGPGFSGKIAASWGLQVTGFVDNSSASPEINITAGTSTIAEVRHKPSQGGMMYARGGVGGAVTTIHTWGPMVASAPTITSYYAHGGKSTLQASATATTTIEVDPGAELTVERDITGGTVKGLCVLNSTSITPAGTVTVESGGELRVVKCGTWATTTGTLVLKAGALADFTKATQPVQLENLTTHAGSVIRKRKGTTPYTVNGTTATVGGGAVVEEV